MGATVRCGCCPGSAPTRRRGDGGVRCGPQRDHFEGGGGAAGSVPGDGPRDAGGTPAGPSTGVHDVHGGHGQQHTGRVRQVAPLRVAPGPQPRQRTAHRRVGHGIQLATTRSATEKSVPQSGQAACPNRYGNAVSQVFLPVRHRSREQPLWQPVQLLGAHRSEGRLFHLSQRVVIAAAEVVVLSDHHEHVDAAVRAVDLVLPGPQTVQAAIPDLDE